MNSRIERLRAHALDHPAPAIRSLETDLLWHRGWRAAKDAGSIIERRAAAKAYALSRITPVIGTDELIVGRQCFRELDARELKELDDLRLELGASIPGYPGQGAHMAIDYEKLLRLGVRGVREEVVSRLSDVDPDSDTAGFYRAAICALDGVLSLSANYSEYAARMAREEPEPVRRNELLEIARIISRVPAGPAATFAEALQSVHFVTAFLEGLYQLGRPDRYLWTYYLRDVETGVIDRARAQELIDCLCILFNEYIPGGLAVGFMIGGTDGDGRTWCNELTEMFLESIAHTRMIYPGVGLCYTPDMPGSILTRSAELLRDGHTHPAIFDDRTIVRGLMDYGLPRDQACEYIHSTCVEITPIAMSAVWVASPYINLLEPLLEVVHAAAAGGVADHGYDELVAEYRNELKRRVDRELAAQNDMQAARYRDGGDALVSCFVKDCIENGLDIDRGGARYNWIMPSFVGMSNLVDSLSAIRKHVFASGAIRLSELGRALDADFDGFAGIRQMLTRDTPHYGNDIDEVDDIAGQVALWIRDMLRERRTFRGDRFIPSLFCWVMHERLGSQTPATPDGRPAGFPLGDGSGPAQGRESAGPTASILSSTKWDHSPFIGGIAVNLKLSRDAFPGGSTGYLESLIRTFADRGGFEIQVNVVDRETLLAARNRPREYADLVVRVGGYSDYFTKLSPNMQDEVILRTEHVTIG